MYPSPLHTHLDQLSRLTPPPQVIVEQTHFYHQDPGIIYQILLTLSTQILGYTFAGLTRQWLVYPGSMIWPGTLMSTAMFTTLHGEENKVANGWRISRWKFFVRFMPYLIRSFDCSNN